MSWAYRSPTISTKYRKGRSSARPGAMKRITIYIDHIDDAADSSLMRNWLEKWKSVVRVEEYSTGGWEHVWDLAAPEEAISEIPED